MLEHITASHQATGFSFLTLEDIPSCTSIPTDYTHASNGVPYKMALQFSETHLEIAIRFYLGVFNPCQLSTAFRLRTIFISFSYIPRTEIVN